MSQQEEFQQQILFEENATKPTQDNDVNSEQLFVDNESWLPVEIEQDTALAEESLGSKPNWLMRSLVVVIATLVGIELVDFFTIGLVESPLSTALYGVVMLLVVLLSGSAVVKEFIGLRQLKKRQQLKSPISISNR